MGAVIEWSFKHLKLGWGWHLFLDKGEGEKKLFRPFKTIVLTLPALTGGLSIVRYKTYISAVFVYIRIDSLMFYE